MSPTMLIISSIQPAVKALTIKPVNGGRNRVVPDQQGIRLALGIQLSSYLFMVIFCACHAGMTSFPGSVSRTSPGIRVVQSRGQLATAPKNPPVLRTQQLLAYYRAERPII